MQNSISKGLDGWKFYSTADITYNSICGENKPTLVGGIGEINYGKQYRQGNRIYVAGKLDIEGKEQIKRVYSPYGISPTLSTMQGGQQQPKVIVNIEWNPSFIEIDRSDLHERR